MPQAVLVQGDVQTFDYTAGADIAAGQVVVTADLIAVAPRAIANGAVGGLAYTGVWDFTKNTGAGVSLGALVYWDDTNDYVSTSSSGNKLIGKCVLAAGSSDVLCRVAMLQ